MATLRTASTTQSRINMVIYGGHGAGKSTYALSSAYLKREDGKPFRILYIDNEMGSVDDYLADLEQNGINLDNILIVYTTSLVETKEFIKMATDKEPFRDADGNIILDADGNPFEADMIVVDGTSVLHKSATQARREFSKKRAKVRADKKEDISSAERFVMIDGADIEIKDYSVIKFDGESLVLDLTASGLHYIVTAREKEKFDTKIIKVNGVDKEVSVSTGTFEPEGFKGLEYNAKTIARIWRDDSDGMIKMKCSKDRTHTYKEGAEVEEPTALDFQKMIEANKKKNFFAPANTMKQDIEREMKKVEREVLGSSLEEDESKAAEKPPVQNTEELAELKAEYKAIYDGLTPLLKENLKQLLVENKINGVSPKNSDVAEMKKRLELINTVTQG